MATYGSRSFNLKGTKQIKRNKTAVKTKKLNMHLYYYTTVILYIYSTIFQKTNKKPKGKKPIQPLLQNFYSHKQS